jgi:predicted GIY-YIG superfamily endonuclease
VTVKTATTTTPRQRKPRQVEPRQLKPRQPKARWLVYLLRCRDGSLYTGITNDLPRRLKTHTAGKASRYTRSRLPVRLAYTEPQPSKSRALKREAAIKKLSRRQKDDLIGGAPTP